MKQPNKSKEMARLLEINQLLLTALKRAVKYVPQNAISLSQAEDSPISGSYTRDFCLEVIAKAEQAQP